MSTNDEGGIPKGPISFREANKSADRPMKAKTDVGSTDTEREVATRGPQTEAAREYLNQLIADIRIMLTYVREIGITIPDGLSEQIEDLLGRLEMGWRMKAS